jgi:hypothetical protein
MEIHVSYKKPQVLQALRYHFISKREIKLMMILVNVFALLSAGLFFFKLINALPFLMSSVLWMAMMFAFWIWLPYIIYKRSKTFQDSFTVILEEDHLFINTEKGQKSWAWREFSNYMETPGFFHLYFDAKSFLLLPKDVFQDDNQIASTRHLLQDKIK